MKSPIGDGCWLGSGGGEPFSFCNATAIPVTEGSVATSVIFGSGLEALHEDVRLDSLAQFPVVEHEHDGFDLGAAPGVAGRAGPTTQWFELCGERQHRCGWLCEWLR